MNHGLILIIMELLMKKNFLITTGGSGGHVIPATILYQHLSKEANVTISTDIRGLKYLDIKYLYY